MVMGHGHFSLIWLGWSAFATLHLLLTAGIPRWSSQELGEDATLNDVLQILDEHYDVIMMFDILSKELYSLKQGSSENVAEFGICLLQQVQILKSEYPGRIQPEHVEEMKHAHFHEGLNPKK